MYGCVIFEEEWEDISDPFLPKENPEQVRNTRKRMWKYKQIAFCSTMNQAEAVRQKGNERVFGAL